MKQIIRLTGHNVVSIFVQADAIKLIELGLSANAISITSLMR
jgi:hypothetical protein